MLLRTKRSRQRKPAPDEGPERKVSMKGCDGCTGKIPLFLEQELQDQELVQFRVHLEQCEACRQELEAEK